MAILRRNTQRPIPDPAKNRKLIFFCPSVAATGRGIEFMPWVPFPYRASLVVHRILHGTALFYSDPQNCRRLGQLIHNDPHSELANLMKSACNNVPMLILIDESGDAGFKVAKGSTSHFVVAMVIFRDLEQAELASANTVRDGFFEAVRPFQFSVRALVVDKERIYSESLRENKGRFYNYFVKMLLKHDGGALQGARVKIDGSGDREFKQELARYLRSESTVAKLASVRFSESHRDNLIQLADMSAGAIFRSYRPDDRKHAGRWRAMLASKIEDVWEFR